MTGSREGSLAKPLKVLTSPNLNIEFSTDSTRTDPQTSRNIFCMKLQVLNFRLVMVLANPLLESFRKSPKTWATNSSRIGKGNPDLPLVCSNCWPPIVALSLCFNHLILSTFRQSPRDPPCTQPVSTTQQSILGETPSLT